MDASPVSQSLDSLWFYSNILTCSDDPLPSLTPPSTPSIDPNESPKGDSNTPHSPLLNLQDESEIVETVNNPCEPETEVKDRGGGRKRRKRRKRSERHGTRKTGVEFGFDNKKVLTGPNLKLNPTNWTLPYHDENAMKEHLKSWAYAVACIVK